MKITIYKFIKISVAIVYLVAYFLTTGLHLHLDLHHISADQTIPLSQITLHYHGQLSSKNIFGKNEHIHPNAKLDTATLLQKNPDINIIGLHFTLLSFTNTIDETSLWKIPCVNFANGPPLAKSILLEYITLKSLRAAPLA